MIHVGVFTAGVLLALLPATATLIVILVGLARPSGLPIVGVSRNTFTAIIPWGIGMVCGIAAALLSLLETDQNTRFFLAGVGLAVALFFADQVLSSARDSERELERKTSADSSG